MAIGQYEGVNNVARKVRNQNEGVNNVCREAERGYIGIDNVSRLFFDGSSWNIRYPGTFKNGEGGYTRLINKEMTFDNEQIVIWAQYERDNSLANHDEIGVLCQFYIGGESLAGRTLMFDYEVSSNLTATCEINQYSIYPSNVSGNNAYKIDVYPFYSLTTGDKSGTVSLVLDDNCQDLRIGLWIYGYYGSTGNVYESKLIIKNMQIDGESFF